MPVIQWVVVLLAIIFVTASADEEPPNIPLGDINLVVLTDVHSWIAGHGHKEPYLNADYGEVLSFYQRLKAYCDSEGKDLWFVMNGDWIDGTGLSLDGDVSYLVPLLEKMPFDVVNTGNHECTCVPVNCKQACSHPRDVIVFSFIPMLVYAKLTHYISTPFPVYKPVVVESMKRAGGFIDWWGHRHLSTNIVMTNNKEEAFSNRYIMLEGKNSRVLVFGFLYHMPDAAPEVTVQNPGTVTNQAWFKKALTEEIYDAILVMAHMGTYDGSVADIISGIRQHAGSDVPVQFVTGHTHVRQHSVVDNLSTAVEAGRYLDTVGFISFPNRMTAVMSEQPIDRFEYAFLDANVNNLKWALGGEHEFATPDGIALQEFIQRTRESLGLTQTIGCSPQDYLVENRGLYEEDSLWHLFCNAVIPSQLEQGSENNRVMLADSGSWRYDLLAGDNTVDDIIAVAPFNDAIHYVGKISCDTIELLKDTLNGDEYMDNSTLLPSFIVAGTVVSGEECELYVQDFTLGRILDALVSLLPGQDFSPMKTNMTSTTLWKDFVSTEWPCDGSPGVHIPWLDNHAIVDESGKTNRKNLAVVLSALIAAISALTGLIYGGWYVVKYTFFGRQSVSQEELDAIVDADDKEAIYT